MPVHIVDIIHNENTLIQKVDGSLACDLVLFIFSVYSEKVIVSTGYLIRYPFLSKHVYHLMFHLSLMDPL
jgi:hypothetical protein